MLCGQSIQLSCRQHGIKIIWLEQGSNPDKNPRITPSVREACMLLSASNQQELESMSLVTHAWSCGGCGSNHRATLDCKIVHSVVHHATCVLAARTNPCQERTIRWAFRIRSFRTSSPLTVITELLVIFGAINAEITVLTMWL